MFAMFLIALLALVALAALGALADSGLRWWSAFERLRQERKSTGGAAQAGGGMRPAIMHGGGSRTGRPTSSPRPAWRPIVRRAA